jgi:dUTP pyrophosphatase
MQLLEGVPLPGAAHGDDAGLDLRAAVGGVVSPGEWTSVPVGIALALPSGTVGLVVPRSGLALQHGVSVLNSPGVIDPGFRGEVHVLLSNSSTVPFAFEVGDRIAQLILITHSVVEWVVVDTLPPSDRGDDGLGASGI